MSHNYPLFHHFEAQPFFSINAPSLSLKRNRIPEDGTNVGCLPLSDDLSFRWMSVLDLHSSQNGTVTMIYILKRKISHNIGFCRQSVMF